MGESDEGFDTYLAPFFDYNGDGVYDANSGDHPQLCGDIAVYSIINDLSNRPDSDTWVPGLGVEVHTMYYAYLIDQQALFNTLFINKRIINRSSTTYSNVYLGLWNDFDIGNFTDDYIATDVQRSMIYGYNGDDFDEGSQSGPGYGDDLPMLGMRIIAGPFQDANGMDDEPFSSQFNAYGNFTSGWGDGIVDNERLGLYASIFHNNMGEGAPPAIADPIVPVDFYNYMQAIWGDGTPLSFGSNGYASLGSPTMARYMFPGTSDPLLAGTNGVDPNFTDPAGWTEETSNNPPGDRRMLASSGPFTFEPGEQQFLDFAYIFARDSHEPGVPLIETLQSYADATVGMECGPLPQIVLRTRDGRKDIPDFQLYPNPANDILIFESKMYSEGRYHVIDLLGKVVAQGLSTGSRTQLSLGHLPKGMYLLRYEADGKAAVRKVVLE